MGIRSAVDRDFRYSLDNLAAYPRTLVKQFEETKRRSEAPLPSVQGQYSGAIATNGLGVLIDPGLSLRRDLVYTLTPVQLSLWCYVEATAIVSLTRFILYSSYNGAAAIPAGLFTTVSAPLGFAGYNIVGSALTVLDLPPGTYSYGVRVDSSLVGITAQVNLAVTPLRK